ncbi:MAG: hypothetical protein ACREXP_22550, partial [Steroidobacteraceae bacterium]
GLSVLAVTCWLHFMLRLVPSEFVWIGLISLVSIVNEVLININRNENRLNKIAWTEFVYFAVALVLVVALWRRLDTELALATMLLGLSLGICAYLPTIRVARWTAVSWSLIGRLIRVGFLPAVLSALLIVVNTHYVLAANWMQLGSAVGQVVFANNLSIMLLFSLNTVAWGLASRAMRRLYIAPGSQRASAASTELMDLFFRVGTVAATLVALAAQWIVPLVMSEYAESGIYTLYSCLFQVHGLLLFSEMNFLSVNSRLRPIIVGYALLVFLLVTVCAALDVQFLTFLRIGIAAYFLLAVGIIAYCRRLQFEGGSVARRLVYVAFPVAAMAAQSLFGDGGVLGVCALFGITALILHRVRLAEILAARRPRTHSR